MARTPRKVCFVITSFIHYSRNLLVLRELHARSDVSLSIIVGGSALLPKYTSSYGSTIDLLERDGFTDIYPVHFTLEGDSLVAKTKTTGLGIIECANAFAKIEPDLVVVRGDRFETLAAAIAASYMNIPVAHIEGGDLSGTLDESVRHAVTKLSHVHLVTNADAKRRIAAMGEHPDYIFEVGSPDVEVAKILSRKLPDDFELGKTGSGALPDLSEKYLKVLFHPVWDVPVEEQAARTKTLLAAVHATGLPTLWYWPNDDTGADAIAGVLRAFNDTTPGHQIRFMRYLPPQIFLPLLAGASCLIGNSSAGLKECSYLGVPVVNVGERQNARLHAKNVKHTSFDTDEILKAIRGQVKKQRYAKDDLYHKAGTAKSIARILATTPAYTQKTFHE